MFTPMTGPLRIASEVAVGGPVAAPMPLARNFQRGAVVDASGTTLAIEGRSAFAPIFS